MLLITTNVMLVITDHMTLGGRLKNFISQQSEFEPEHAACTRSALLSIVQ
jgi:hypothetical protein